jgi:hypothetical protein
MRGGGGGCPPTTLLSIVRAEQPKRGAHLRGQRRELASQTDYALGRSKYAWKFNDPKNVPPAMLSRW